MKTVLLLEDDRDLRALLKTALVAYGLEVLEAGRGSEADATLQSRTVDLIVVDGLLPDTSGVAFIQRLRSRDRRMPLVFVTALFRDRKTFKQLTQELDVPLVLYKPLDPIDFAAKIADLLARAGAARPPERRRKRRALVPRELAQWQRDYSEGLPRKLLALEHSLRANRMAAARMLAHGLRGSSGSFGYPEVGEIVGTIEDLIVEGMENRMTSQIFWQRVDHALQNARRAAAAAPAPAAAPRGRQRVILSSTVASVAPRAQSPWAGGGARPKVLLVDDEEDILRIARVSLEEVGNLTVVTTGSAREALALAAAESPDLILMDVMMPLLDGPSAFLELQRDPRLRTIPVIFMTAKIRQSEADQYLAAGAVGVIQKPFDPMTLPDEIWRIMRARFG
jgi:CheY-like chemotaxis protein